MANSIFEMPTSKKTGSAEDIFAGSSSSGMNLPLPNLDFPPDPELISQGWQRRFMADTERASEASEIYTNLGYEVLSIPVKSEELSSLCGDCKLVVCRSFVTIYTRKN